MGRGEHARCVADAKGVLRRALGSAVPRAGERHGRPRAPSVLSRRTSPGQRVRRRAGEAGRRLTCTEMKTMSEHMARPRTRRERT
eukprot:scaffold4525_cov125-Isochrysis_galbana.AAC.4